MRSRSSREAKSMLIRPRCLPRSTRTRVSSRSLSRSASSFRPGLTSFVLILHGAERHDLLHRPHRQPLGDDAMGQAFLPDWIRDREQGPRVPGRQHARGDPPLHGRG